MADSPGEATLLLQELRQGNKDALNQLMPLVYRELRRLAAYYLRRERIGHTLQPTALVHEAYLRLVGQDRAQWEDRGQFMRVAAEVMRRILVDYARGRGRAKRGGETIRIDLDGYDLAIGGPQFDEILLVDEALQRLSELDGRQGQVVELRYFAGLTVEETAEALGISPRTVKREWTVASAWLRNELRNQTTERAGG